MKKITVLILLLIYSFFINTNAQWVQIPNGMGTDKNVKCFASNSSYIFAGVSTYGIFRYAGNGWTQTSLNNQTVNSVVTNLEILFASTNANGIYRSTDNGATFTQVSTLTSEVCLAISGNYIFAGTVPLGVYISTNNGNNWTQTSLNNQSVKCIATNGSNIYAGTYSGGVFLSTNYGTTWIQTSLNNRDVRSIAINGSNIFAGTNGYGIYVSTNNGSTWAQTPLTTDRFNGLITINNNIFAGGDGGIFQSSNNGATWITRNEGNPGPANAFYIGPTYILAGTFQSVFARMLSEVIGIQNISAEIPSSFSLYQNYPNPFNPTTKIRFAIPLSRGVSASGGRGVFTQIIIYDILGREVTTLVNEQLNPGTYEVDFDGSNCTSGVYFYKLLTGDFNQTKKMLIIK